MEKVVVSRKHVKTLKGYLAEHRVRVERAKKSDTVNAQAKLSNSQLGGFVKFLDRLYGKNWEVPDIDMQMIQQVRQEAA